MNTKSRVVGLLLAAGAVCSAYGELLMYDGFPTDKGGYAVGASAKVDLKSFTVRDPRVVGFNSDKWENASTAVIYAFKEGLSLPEGFPSENVGGGKMGTCGNGWTSQQRAQWKPLTPGCMAGADSLHFRCLLSIEASSLEHMVGGDTRWPLSERNYFGVGLVKTSKIGNTTLHDDNTSHELAFVIRKDPKGVSHLSVVMKGAGDTALACRNLIDAPVGGTTYLCYAEIGVGAGTNGKETIRALAVPVTEAWDPALKGLKDVGEVELVSEAEEPTQLVFGADYEAQAYVDEIALGTEARDVVLFSSEAPRIDVVSLEKTAEGGRQVSATIALHNATVWLEATDGENKVELSESVAVEAGGTATLAVDQEKLSPDKTYLLTVCAVNGEDVTRRKVGIVYAGRIALTTVRDAEEEGLKPAVVRVSRASADPYPLVVGLSVSSSDGVSLGTDWVQPVETVTIPAGADFVDFEVIPMVNLDVDTDRSAQVKLTDAATILDTTASVAFWIRNCAFPKDRNVWVAREDSDGRASTAANWTLGVPNAADAASRTLVLDGTYSTKSMTWDLPAVNSLAGYLSTANYTGEVVIPTRYPDAGEFEALTVEGDMEVLGGVIKSQMHEKTQASGVYRLKLNVNGNLTIGADGRIDVSGRGLYSNKGNAAGHGGDVGAFSSSAFTFVRYDPSAAHPAHGSILLPTEVGFGANSGTDNESKRCFGGGALDLTVAGILTNDGRILAEGGNEYAASGSGGSILIHAKSLAGSGTYSVNARKANKSDGTGAMGAGGRIAVYVTEGTLDRAKFSALSYREGWGKMGGHGTIYLDSPDDKRICVVGQWTGKSRISGWNWATTPIPAADDPADWVRDFRKVTLIASTSANLRLTRSIRMRAVEVRYEEKDVNARVGARVDLAGNTLTVQKVIVDGVDLKLPPGVYTAAEVKDRANMGWLVDSSQQKFDFTETYNGAERNVRDLTKYGYGETPTPGELRVVGTGLRLIVR